MQNIYSFWIEKMWEELSLFLFFGHDTDFLTDFYFSFFLNMKNKFYLNEQFFLC